MAQTNRAVIEDVLVRTVLNSNGELVPEVEIWLADGTRAAEASPLGTTTGKFDAPLAGPFESEALVQTIRTQLRGLDASDQRAVDSAIGSTLGTEEGRLRAANLGAAASMAVCRAAATCRRLPVYSHIARTFERTPSLPRPLFNVLNGGAHAGTGLWVAELLLVARSGDTRKTITGAAAVHEDLRLDLGKLFGPSSTRVGLEGGFAPDLADPTFALDLIAHAIDRSGTHELFGLGVDLAAGNLYRAGIGRYELSPRESARFLRSPAREAERPIVTSWCISRSGWARTS